MISSKSKSNENIDIIIEIGDYKLQMYIPRETKVNDLVNMVKSYEQIHDAYAPMDGYFIGLASKDNNPVIDYWLSQNQLDFCRFTQRKLLLKALYSIQKYIDKLTISQFQFLKCLGKGVIGQVYLVRNRVTGYLFAMKRLKKQSINDFKSWGAVIRQKKILSLLPANLHTVRFHGSFQSQNYFNFLLDYYPGGQLFIHLSSNQQKLSEKQVKTYFCQILLAMEFLHKNKILYRDLKPENILVDIQGHLRITDFGLSKCGFQEENIAHTICGSDQYMAPEIIDNKNYNFSADFYSIGAILYQLLTGLPPYYQEQNAHQKLQQMKAMDLDFSFVRSLHLRQLLENLLNSVPELRLCNYHEIKNNPWLSDINWKEIQNKKSTLKFAPDIYKSYICQEFLQLQDEVQQMNGQENQQFQRIFQGLFDFVIKSSQSMVLGTRPSISSVGQKNNHHEHQLREIKNSKNHLNMKRKTTGFIKQKPKNTTKHKPNYSIQLFQRQDSTSSSHTSSTQNSNCSNLPYDPKTTRNIDLKNKENVVNFKKSTKKLMIINDTLAKITRQPSEKKLLTKQPSQSNLIKQKQNLQHKIILRQQPSTPIRLMTSHHNCSIEQKQTNKIMQSKNEVTLKLVKQKQNHFSSRSKIQNYQTITSHEPSSKRLTTRISQNFASINEINPKEKPNKQNRSNMKSKTKEKSKSKDKLQIKARTKQNFSSNSSTNGLMGQKVKLPSCTYKIKLV